MTRTWCRRSPDVQGTVSWTLPAPQRESSTPPTLKIKHLEILMNGGNKYEKYKSSTPPTLKIRHLKILLSQINMRYAKLSDTVLKIQHVAFGLFQIQRLDALPTYKAIWSILVLRRCNMVIRSILFQCFRLSLLKPYQPQPYSSFQYQSYPNLLPVDFRYIEMKTKVSPNLKKTN